MSRSLLLLAAGRLLAAVLFGRMTTDACHESAGKMGHPALSPAPLVRSPMRFLSRHLIAPILLALAMPAAAQVVQWSRVVGSAEGQGTCLFGGDIQSSGNQAMAVNAAGDVVAVGSCASQSTVGDIRIVKYSGSDGSVIWKRDHNGAANNSDEANAVAFDGAGNVVVAGTMRDQYSQVYFWAAKFAAADGSLIWESTLSAGTAQAVAVDASGDVIVAGKVSLDSRVTKLSGSDGSVLWGQTDSFGSAGDKTLLALGAAGEIYVAGSTIPYGTRVVKRAPSDGAISWARTIPADQDRFLTRDALTVDGDGNAIVTGSQNGPSGGSELRVQKFASSDGTLLWEAAHGDSATGMNTGESVEVDATGNIYVTGQRSSFSSTDRAMTALKFAGTDGAFAWAVDVVSAAGIVARGKAVTLDGAGQVFVAGVSSANSGESVIARLSPANGSLQWLQSLPTLGADIHPPTSIAIAPDGSLVAASTNQLALLPATDFIIRKLAVADGAVQWTSAATTFRVSTAISAASPSAIARDASNGLYAIGNPDDYQSAGRIFKVDAASGASVWNTFFAATGANPSTGVAVRASPDGQLLAAGRHSQFGTSLLVRKFAGSDGSTLWSNLGDPQEYATPFTFAVSSDGSSVVGGHRSTPSGGTLFATKFSAAGTTQWQYPFGCCGDTGTPFAAAIDAGGTVAVAGNAVYPLTAFRTQKVASASGSLAWEASLASPSPLDLGFETFAVAFDSLGNVIVAGLVNNGQSSGDRFDLRILKYAADDGSLLWQNTRVVSISGNRRVHVALDRIDNPVVASSADLYPDPVNILVTKVSGASGNTLWSTTDYGFADPLSVVNGIAVDRAGNVLLAGSLGDPYSSLQLQFRALKLSGRDGRILWTYNPAPGRYGEGVSVITEPGAVYVAGNCTLAGSPLGVCVSRLENKSTVTLPLQAPATAVFGTPVLLDATGAAADDGTSSTAGIYTFRDGSTVLCTGAAKTCSTSTLALGAHSITVTFEGNADSEATTSSPLSLNVTLLVQAITFTSTPPSPAGVGGPAYTVTATGGASGNPVAFSIDASSTPGACTIAPPVVSFTGPGTCKVNANQAGNASYDPAPQVQQSIDVSPAASLLQVAVAGASGGLVTSSPAGISCPGDCAETYPYNATVTLTPSAQPGTVFTGWSGSCSGAGPCVLPMVAARGVTATFAPVSPAAAVDIVISHQASPVPPSAGKDLVVKWTATNASAVPASGVTLLHRSVLNAALVWASPGCVMGSGAVTCDMGALAPGQSAQRVIVLRPEVPGTVAYDATVAAIEVDSNTQDNSLPPVYNANASAAGVPVLRYRLYSPVTREHHFTTDLNEYNVLGTYAGTWVQEGTVGQVLDNPGSYNGVAATPYYRLYDTSNGQHLWTTDPNEYYTLGLFPQYSGEGVDGYLLPTQAPGTIPLYRLMYPYSVPVAGLHHWTIDPVEYVQLVAYYGWVGEGGSEFVIP